MTQPHPGPGTPAADSPQPPAPAPLTPLHDLRTQITAHLGEAARTWLAHALDEAAARPATHGPISAWELRLAEAGRRCGTDHADAVRVLILDAAQAGPDALTRVYRQGTAAERRAVLHALPHLVAGPDALPSSRTPCAPTTPASSPRPSARTPPVTWTPTTGATPC